jgi:prophage antirepressor-like protein
MDNSGGKLAVFKGKHIRKILLEGEWWFSIIDVVEVLTDSSIPKRYWSDLKRKLINEGFSEAYEKIVRLKMLTPDGKMRITDCANTETMFRIVQSIPSPKVEPLKRWLARVGKDCCSCFSQHGQDQLNIKYRMGRGSEEEDT